MNGGGTILIRGDQGGNNPDVFNARHTFVDVNVKIAADALILEIEEST